MIFKNLTEQQFCNWESLIRLLGQHDYPYDHELFVKPQEWVENNYFNHSPCCAASFAFIFNIAQVNRSFPDDFEFIHNEVKDELRLKFGPDCIEEIFDAETPFADYMLKLQDNEYFDSITTSQVSKWLVDYLEIEKFDDVGHKVIHVEVTWKNNVKDLFPTVESIEQFLKLNSHRHPKKIIVVELVPRTVYDEVKREIKIEADS